MAQLQEQRPPLEQSRPPNHTGHSSDSSSGSDSGQEGQRRRRRSSVRGRNARARPYARPYASSRQAYSSADSRQEEMFRQILELQKQNMEAERQSKAEFFHHLAQLFGTFTNFMFSQQHPRPAAAGGVPEPALTSATTQHLTDDTQGFSAFSNTHPHAPGPTGNDRPN